jgi:hypothetical protein
MEQHAFCILIDYRGHHRKGVANYIATYLNLQQKPWFHWTKNVFLNITLRFKQEKSLLIDIILPRKKNSYDLFRAAHYRFMLDLLFH